MTEFAEIPRPGTPEWNRNLPRPQWLRVRIHTEETYGRVNNLIKRGRLHTVCREAKCPNIGECWTDGTATFIVMGDICTRSCAYCAVKSGRPLALDEKEPLEVALAVESMGLKHAVVTSVDRDDLPDYGSGHIAEVIKQIHARCPHTDVEVLIPDFMGDESALLRVLEAGPKVLNHNTETVPRLYPRLRSRGDYGRCLELLERSSKFRAQNPDLLVKSGLMVGLSETEDEVKAVFRDLRSVGVDILTVGQYLRPSLKHVPVMRFWTPEEFDALRAYALEIGFKFVESGPLVRSSYHAARHRPEGDFAEC